MLSAIRAEIMSNTPGDEISPGCFKRLANAPFEFDVLLIPRSVWAIAVPATARHYCSGLIPAALTTSGQRFSSFLMKASKSCGVPPMMSAACASDIAVRTEGTCRT